MSYDETSRYEVDYAGRALRERAILVGTRSARMHGLQEEDILEEPTRLADTAGADIVASITQTVRRTNPATLIGRGKVTELAEAVSRHGADCVVFDSDLTPAQIGTIETEVGVKVLDRTDLILAIFARHARTRELRLQVELAQLTHLAPRLTGRWGHLSRQHGGIGARGPGESQLETDRRIVRTRITELKRRIKRIEKRSDVRKTRRMKLFNIVLVGYTNAGKSTLLNALTGSSAHVADRLFATLDALTRRVRLDSGKTVTITDTVGFIDRLPAELITSFHTTLSEAASADLLLAVTDVSRPGIEERLGAVDVTLGRIGAASQPRLIVFNKVDAVSDEQRIGAVKRRYPDAVFVSAAHGWGIDTLRSVVDGAASGNRTNGYPARYTRQSS
jgi:GTP-binding protein HflX